MLPYAGWVPTSQGRLAYARIGDSRHPDVAVFANIELNGVAAAPEVRDRVLLGYQHRSLGDGAFKHRIAKWFLNQSGDFWFVLAGRTADSRTEEACLRGAVYIYDDHRAWQRARDNAAPVTRRARLRQAWQRLLSGDELGSGLRRRIHYLRGEAKDVEKAALPTDRLDPAVLEHFVPETLAELEKGYAYKVYFELRRTGEVFFSDVQFRDNMDRVAKFGVKLADTPRGARTDNLDWYVANQCFCFLRDVSHKHQHHHASLDSLMSLGARDAADIKWRRSLILDLHNAAIDAKRFGRHEELSRAAGVMAYCEAFEQVCHAALGQPLASAVLPRIYAAAVLRSIDAKLEELRAEDRLLQQRGFAISRNGLLLNILVAIVAVSAVLLQPKVRPYNDKNVLDVQGFAHLDDWSSWLATPLHMALVFGTPLVMYLGYVIYRLLTTKAALLGLPRGPVGALMAAPVLGALSIEVVRLLSSMRLAKQPRKVGYLLGAVSLGLLVLAIGASVAMGWLALP